MVDIRRGRRPAVIETADVQRRVARVRLLRFLYDRVEILPGEVLVAHFARAAHVESNRAEPGRVLLVERRVAARCRPQRGLGDKNIHRMPLAGAQRRRRRASSAGCAATATPRGIRWRVRPAARPRGIGRRVRASAAARRVTSATTTPGRDDALARHLFTLRVQRDGIRAHLVIRQRDVHAAHAAVRRFLQVQQHARTTLTRALVVGEELHVLEAPVHDEPATRAAGFRGTDELAVLRLPGGISHDVPAGQRRACEGAVRDEGARLLGVERERQRGDRRARHRERSRKRTADVHDGPLWSWLKD